MTFQPLPPNSSVSSNQPAPKPARAVVVARTRDANDQKFLWIAIAGALFVLLSLFAVTSFGQQPPQYDVVERLNAFNDPRNIRRMKTELKKLASQGAADQGIVRAYYGSYVPAVFTAPANGAEMSEVSRDLRDFLNRASRSRGTENNIYQRVLAMTRDSMVRVIDGNHLPTGRVMATTILGTLNQEPLNTSARKPPVPYLAVFPKLLELYENENEVDGVRAAALSGLERHVKLAFPQIVRFAPVREKLQTQMSALLTTPPPAGRTAEAHAFMQRYAVSILAQLRDPADKSLGVQLVGLSTNNQAPDLIAFHSASELGTMANELAGSVQDIDATLANWTARFYVAFEREIDRVKLLLQPREPAPGQPVDPDSLLEDENNPNAGITRGSGGGGNFFSDTTYSAGGGFGFEDETVGIGAAVEPQPPIVKRSRGKINSMVQKIHRGATGSDAIGVPGQPRGLYAVANPAEQQKISQWVTKLTAIMNEVNDRADATEDEYLVTLQEQLEAIGELAGPAAIEQIQAKRSGLPAAVAGNESADAGAADAAPAADPIDTIDDPLAAAGE